MTLSLLTPLAALVALAAALPLAAAALVARRADRVRLLLGLPARARRAAPAAAIAAAAVLVGLAASQPILERSVTSGVRADAEAYVVLDVSRSMLARERVDAATRFERARVIALELRERLGDVRVGLASLTDRVLPHLFPSPSEDAFAATLRGSVGIERPPPAGVLSLNATWLESLKAVPSRRFFSDDTEHRLLVVLTDGETRPVNEPLVGQRLRRPPSVETVFVHVWGVEERVFSGGAPEADYRPDPTARDALDRLAEATDGAVFAEDEAGPLARAARDRLGEGPIADRETRRRRWALAPFFLGAAFVPLGLLVGRRSR